MSDHQSDSLPTNKPSTLLKGVNVYLIGMMGSGKSTIGKILAQKLNYRFFDTDVLIEKVAQKTIPEIFATEGEAYFRDLETKVLHEVSAYNHSVIATGGGMIQKTVNWSFLRQGLIVWLDADLDVLLERVAKDTNRPLAGKLQSLLEKRSSLYAQADLRIVSDRIKTPKQVASEIIDKIPSKLLSPNN
ncbi:shikimate kinase [Xenococcus sp. PCC 7305]|uniref:shikimate kinase n=1 Tax=Xenococcus sp. PCC 7305 TaxID=102125 RepID=UPI0002ABCA5F|nr:shikimate kinase [Xenococcus sp. PCC 7305]ELS05084.1 shikimate kinase [Xenococcus sp. PCC 7305]